MQKVYPSVEQIKVMKTTGPWKTKSGGSLLVRAAVPFEELMRRFFTYDEEALRQPPIDLRGLRFYTVTDLMRGAKGGGEFHEIRSEFVFVIVGCVRWQCEDLAFGAREWTLTPGEAILMPSHILHGYHVEADHTSLLVVANTLFDPADPRTHDTYSADVFHALQGSTRV